jgi:hypothetical protein
MTRDTTWTRITNKQSVHTITLRTNPPSLQIHEAISSEDDNSKIDVTYSFPSEVFKLQAVEEAHDSCFLLFEAALKLGQLPMSANELQNLISTVEKYESIWPVLSLKRGGVCIQVPYTSSIRNWNINFARMACDATGVESTPRGKLWPNVQPIEAFLHEKLAEVAPEHLRDNRSIVDASKDAEMARTLFRSSLRHGDRHAIEWNWRYWQSSLNELDRLKRIKHCVDLVNQWVPELKKEADARKVWLKVGWAKLQGEDYWKELRS